MLTPREQELSFGFANSLYAHQRMRRAIFSKRMAYDFEAADRYEADSCPPWLRSKLYWVAVLVD